MASLTELSNLLETNVLEVKFIRRNPKPGAASTRRAFITTSNSLLNSPRGKITLRYEGGGGSGLKFTPAARNLILAWDILWQEYRLFGAEGSSIITQIPVTTEDEVAKFWDYFDSNILPLSPEDKLRFMNS
jgi:hypothetical protein